MHHYAGLLLGYATALLAMAIIARHARPWRERRPAPAFAHPWRELGWALVAAAMVVVIGVVYSQHYITTMYARDLDSGNVINLVEFVTRGPAKASMATMTFQVPQGVSRIMVYAYCNEHDLWVTTETAV